MLVSDVCWQATLSLDVTSGTDPARRMVSDVGGISNNHCRATLLATTHRPQQQTTVVDKDRAWSGSLGENERPATRSTCHEPRSRRHLPASQPCRSRPFAVVIKPLCSRWLIVRRITSTGARKQASQTASRRPGHENRSRMTGIARLEVQRFVER